MLGSKFVACHPLIIFYNFFSQFQFNISEKMSSFLGWMPHIKYPGVLQLHPPAFQYPQPPRKLKHALSPSPQLLSLNGIGNNGPFHLFVNWVSLYIVGISKSGCNRQMLQGIGICTDFSISLEPQDFFCYSVIIGREPDP